MGGQIKRSVTALPVHGDTVLVRADLDVPIIHYSADELSLRPAAMTIRYLLDRNNKVVVIGHISRPNGYDGQFSTRLVAKALANLLRVPVHHIGAISGPKAMMAIKRAPKGSVLLLENLRFDPREEKNDAQFAAEIVKSTGAKYFVQDDRRAIKHAHASTVAITDHLPSVAGFNVIDVWDAPGVKSLLDA